jgi:hypothetical protein
MFISKADCIRGVYSISPSLFSSSSNYDSLTSARFEPVENRLGLIFLTISALISPSIDDFNSENC